LASLLIALLAFYAWHTPLRGPLTDAEIDAFMTTQAANAGTDWSDEAAFEAFLRNDDGRPFVMINLMEYRQTAEYSDESALAADITGAEASALYGQAVLPQLLLRGSYPVERATRYNTIINSVGETAGEFESFAMVRYRSRRDLIDMLSSDAFGEANIHKWASLENTLVAPSKSGASFKFIGFIPLVLFVALGVGLGGLFLGRRGS
ncbi:MAG: hypothetical protein AAGD43_34600, partial [Pseudomonadota bacterium]